MWAQAERRQAGRLRTGAARQDGAPGDRPKEEGPRPPAARPVRSPTPSGGQVTLPLPSCAGPTALSPFPRDGGPGELNTPHHCCHRDVSRARGLKSTLRVGGGTQEVQRDPGLGLTAAAAARRTRRSSSHQGESWHGHKGPELPGTGPAHTLAHTRVHRHTRVLCSIPAHSSLVEETRPEGRSSPTFWICLAVSPWPRLPPSVPCPSGAGCVERSAQVTP